MLTIKRFADAQPYEAPHHHGVRSLRLQGFEPDGPETFWVGLSHILPGGGAGPDASPLEKTYVILSGHLTVRADGQDQVLGQHDSCTIAPNTEREIINLGNDVVTMVVVMPYPVHAP
jgi:quercetin dioxygenase-like cupin family protein